jgi:hypothetical protein
LATSVEEPKKLPKSHSAASTKMVHRERFLSKSSSIEEEEATVEEEEEEGKEKPNKTKRGPVRRCGTLLIKHIQTVCNGCLRSASGKKTVTKC